MPKKFFRRKDKFLAVQWSASRFAEIRELTRGRVYYEGKTKQYLLHTEYHDFILKDGDYIVESRNDFEVWSEDVFETLFEIVPGQEEDGNA